MNTTFGEDDMDDNMPWMGIDFGTCNTSVALWHEGRSQIVPNKAGKSVTPSVVAINTETGKVTVGQKAISMSVANPANTIFDVKRLLGKKFDDELIIKDKEQWPFTIVKDAENNLP